MTKAAALPITGYLDRLSCRPGETLEAKISVQEPGPCQVTLQRLICADPNPNGPGIRIESLAHRYSHAFEGRTQPIAAGSYAAIPAGPPRAPDAACTWTALVCPGRPD